MSLQYGLLAKKMIKKKEKKMKTLLVSLVQKIHIKTDINLNKIKIKDSIAEWQLQINNSLYLEITFSDI